MDVDVYDYDKISGFDAADLAKITGFEVLEIIDTLENDSIDVSKIPGITSFVAGDGVLRGNKATITGVTSGSSVTLAGDKGNDGELVVEVKDAATGEADVLNLKLNKEIADDADTNVDLNPVPVTVTAADVETVNVEATGVRGAATEIDLNNYTLTLNNDELVTLNISGDAVLTFVAASTMEDLATINASANTAGVNITIDSALTQTVTITGAAADDTIDLSANDVVNAGAGDDYITLANLAQVTGGAGEDTFVMTASASQVSYATILDFSTADDSIATGAANFNATKITLAGNAVFSDFVEAAAARGEGELSWFQFNGNTYLVKDTDTEAANFVNGKDAVVEIVGLVDFSTATLDNTGVLSFA
jgi:S-layer protein